MNSSEIHLLEGREIICFFLNQTQISSGPSSIAMFEEETKHVQGN